MFLPYFFMILQTEFVSAVGIVVPTVVLIMLHQITKRQRDMKWKGNNAT